MKKKNVIQTSDFCIGNIFLNFRSDKYSIHHAFKVNIIQISGCWVKCFFYHKRWRLLHSKRKISAARGEQQVPIGKKEQFVYVSANYRQDMIRLLNTLVLLKCVSFFVFRSDKSVSFITGKKGKFWRFAFARGIVSVFPDHILSECVECQNISTCCLEMSYFCQNNYSLSGNISCDQKRNCRHKTTTFNQNLEKMLQLVRRTVANYSRNIHNK